MSHQQLDQWLICELAPRLPARAQGREMLAEDGREGMVDHIEHRFPRPEVRGQPHDGAVAKRRTALAEDRHIGVPEAVDRLEFVAHGGQVAAFKRF